MPLRVYSKAAAKCLHLSGTFQCQVIYHQNGYHSEHRRLFSLKLLSLRLTTFTASGVNSETIFTTCKLQPCKVTICSNSFCTSNPQHFLFVFDPSTKKLSNFPVLSLALWLVISVCIYGPSLPIGSHHSAKTWISDVTAHFTDSWKNCFSFDVPEIIWSWLPSITHINTYAIKVTKHPFFF